jgi:hypothetical protein
LNPTLIDGGRPKDMGVRTVALRHMKEPSINIYLNVSGLQPPPYCTLHGSINILMLMNVNHGQGLELTRYLQMCERATKSWLLHNPGCYAELIRDGLMNTPRKKNVSVTYMILNTSLSHTPTSHSAGGPTSTTRCFISLRVSRGLLPRRC